MLLQVQLLLELLFEYNYYAPDFVSSSKIKHFSLLKLFMQSASNIFFFNSYKQIMYTIKSHTLARHLHM